jgi:hypothetical protein
MPRDQERLQPFAASLMESVAMYATLYCAVGARFISIAKIEAITRMMPIP